MNKSRLLEILKVFKPKEIKEFSEYVRSPFFNKNEGVISLFGYLKNFYPAFPEEHLSKEKVYSKIFPGAKYNDGFMRKTIFALSTLAKNYLVYSGTEHGGLAAKNILLKEFQHRKKTALFNRTYLDISGEIGKTAQLNADIFYFGYISSFRNISFAAEHKNIDFSKFIERNDIFEPFEYLSAHFLSSVMSLYEYYLNTQNILNLDFDKEYFDRIIGSFNPEIINKYPLLKIHNNLLKMLQEPGNYKLLTETKKLLSENEGNLDKNELENIYINLQNFCMKQIRSNRMNYLKELLEIYKMELKNSCFSESNPISSFLYRNIIFTSLKEKEIDFADDFAEKYRDCLAGESRDSGYHYAKAHIALKKKDYNEVGKHLGKIRNMDELMKNDVKSMYVLLYYETKSVSQFSSLIDTFRHNLKYNRKLSAERIRIYNAFLNFANRLFLLNENFNKPKYLKLRNEIEKTENVIKKGWLTEKLNEIAGQNQ